MPTFRALLSILVLTLAASAQSVGPDVIVGSIPDVSNYAPVGTTYAYALGTTSCNLGTVDLGWISNLNQHPVIGQNIYRLKAVPGQPYSRFEQIGMSWLKHGFTALTGSLCGTCNTPGTGSLLGVGCSDPYSSSLNGSQGNGPRNEVNPSTGEYRYPIGSGYPSGTTNTVQRRIQCQAADVDPAQNAGATYYGEGQYVTPDDARAGNKNNNASYRQMTFAATTFQATLAGPTFQQLPAIKAWKAADPAVIEENVDWPNDGRFLVSKKITSMGGGVWHYEFAVHNLNSQRSGRAFTVDFPPGTLISGAGFHDINYHSGEPYSGTDWNNAINGSSITWFTDTFASNPNANALRWGTLYNFWCDATSATDAAHTIEPFRCPADTVAQPAIGYALDTNASFDNPVIAGSNGPVGNNVSMNVPIGFTFNFYGTNYGSVYISTNGFLTFVNSGTTVSHNTGLPVATSPNATIAGYWDDLNAPSAGQITYATIGAAPFRRFVVSYNAVGLNSNLANTQTFKIILDETTNVITTTIIATMDGGASASCGIERQDGIYGVQASLNTPGSVVANKSLRYTPTLQILPSASLEVTGSTGPNGVLTWDLDSSAVGAQVILVASTDPGPSDMGPLGSVGIGFLGQFVVLADAPGVFGVPNPADVTAAPCGTFTTSVQLDNAGLPPGMTVYNQAIVIPPPPGPPPVNGQLPPPPPPNATFHLTNVAVLNT